MQFKMLENQRKIRGNQIQTHLIERYNKNWNNDIEAKKIKQRISKTKRFENLNKIGKPLVKLMVRKKLIESEMYRKTLPQTPKKFSTL